MPNAVAGNLPFRLTTQEIYRLAVPIRVGGRKALLTHPCVGRVEVAFDGTLPFRGWQTCLGPTFNTLDEDSLTPGLRLNPKVG